MTVTTETTSTTQDCNGAVKVFNIPFRFFLDTDIKVYTYEPATQTQTLLVQGSQYTLTGAGAPTAVGTVTTVTTYPLGISIIVVRDMPLTQLTDIVNQGPFFPEIHENVFDRLIMQIQQSANPQTHALHVPYTDPIPEEVPAVQQRANKVLAFDEFGNPIVSSLTLSQIEASGGLSYSSRTTQTITATAGQTVLTINEAYVPGTNQLAVNVNGEILTPVLDYAETNGTTVTLAVPLTAGDVVLIEEYSATSYSTDAANVGYNGGNLEYYLDNMPGADFTQDGQGAVVRTSEDKMREAYSVKDFGAIGDGTLHTIQEWITSGRYANLAAVQVDYPHCAATTESIDKIAIQAAINASIYLGIHKKIRVNAGVYISDGPIHLGYGDTFKSCWLDGDGIRYNTESGFNGTGIIFTHNNAPGLVVQGGRSTKISNLSINGENGEWITSHGCGTSSGTSADLDAAYWVDPTFPAASSSRYAVYAGVAIDPYSGPRPATSYPDVKYPPYLYGGTGQYNKVYSNYTMLDNVTINGFVVGLVVQPCDADGNGDFTKLTAVQITQCQYGVSICNTQSRLVHAVDGTMSTVHTGIVTMKHGRQNGKPSILVEMGDFSQIIKWIDIPNIAFGGAPRFVSCYGELVYSLGNAGVNSSGSSSVDFVSCDVGFELQAYRGVPKYTFDNGGNGFAKFSSCSFGSSPNSHYAFGGSAKNLVFNQCVISASFPIANLYEKFSLNATAGITCSRLGTDYGEFKVWSDRFNLDTGAGISLDIVTPTNTGPRTECLPVVTKRAMAVSGQQDPGATVNIIANAYGKGGWTITTSGRDVTVATGTTNSWFMNQFGLCVGDTVWDDVSNITFRIRSRTDGTFIMRAISGYDELGNLLTPMNNTGALYFLNSRYYTPTYPFHCESISGNNTLTNITRGDDTAAFINTDIAVGDYVSYIAWGDRIGAENGSIITARDGTARTLTMLYGANRTSSFRRVALFIRAEAPNA